MKAGLDARCKRRRPWSIGHLPAAFIVLALLNFIAGTVLGALMALEPNWWGILGPIHGILNPFGWLTMLIYGMTYAVLRMIAGLRLPWPWLGWVHALLGELGVVLMILSHLRVSESVTFWMGITCLFLSPVLFLVNILASVITKRARGKDDETREDRTPPLYSLLFGKPQYAKATDRVGQRGTELALMVFIVTDVWMVIRMARLYSGSEPAWPDQGLALVYYGWILGTVLHVAIHLYPRFVGRATFPAWVPRVGQILWILGSVGMTVTWTDHPLVFRGFEWLLGLSVLWFSFAFLFGGGRRFEAVVPRASRYAWYVSWTFCALLGVFLCSGDHPLSLWVLHTLFLGMLTTLVYSVGYTLFPLLLGRKPRHLRVMQWQVWLAAASAVFMILGFWGLDTVSAEPWPRMVLGVGGVVAALAFYLFCGLFLAGVRVNEEGVSSS